MKNTRSYSCLQRLLHFDCDPFRSSSCSTSVVQLHHHRPHAMMKIQFFKKKWLTDFRQVIDTGCVCHLITQKSLASRCFIVRFIFLLYFFLFFFFTFLHIESLCLLCFSPFLSYQLKITCNLSIFIFSSWCSLLLINFDINFICKHTCDFQYLEM